MLSLQVEHIFLAIFYDLYFNHHFFFLHITLYNFSSSYNGIDILYAVAIQIRMIQLLLFIYLFIWREHGRRLFLQIL